MKVLNKIVNRRNVWLFSTLYLLAFLEASVAAEKKDPVLEALDKRDAALNQYNDVLFKNPKMSKAEKKKLREKMVGPHEKALKSTVKDVHKDSMKLFVNKTADRWEGWLDKKPGKKSKVEEPVAEADTEEEEDKKSKNKPRRVSNSGLVLDGSQLKDQEFDQVEKVEPNKNAPTIEIIGE